MADSGENNVSISSLFTSKLMKWRVNEGQDVKERTVLALYEKVGQSNDQKGFNLQPKLRSNVNGRIKKLLVAEGDVVPPGKPVIQIEKSVACEHTTVMKDLCCDCGMDLRKLASDQDEPSSPTLATVSMIHNIPELRVTQDEAEAVGKKDEERLLSTRKLALVVDLDQTMIHTTIELVPSDMKDVYHFNLSGYPLWYHTKFRPFAHEFLEKISKLYELHIFTMGSRMYAHTIARMLDPDEGLFGHRIRSRDDCFNAFSKSNDLRSLFPRGDSMVCIIDDRNDVWNNAPNLIKVKPYQFFKGVGDINAPSDKQQENAEPKSDNKGEGDEEVEDTSNVEQNVNKEDMKKVEAESKAEEEIAGKDRQDGDPSGEQSDSKDDIENSTENYVKEKGSCTADDISLGKELPDCNRVTQENMEICPGAYEKKLVKNDKNGESSSKEISKESDNSSTCAESSHVDKMEEAAFTAENSESEKPKQVNHISEESTQNVKTEGTANSTLTSNKTRNHCTTELQNEQQADARSKETISESIQKFIKEDIVHEKDTQDTGICNNNNGSDIKEKKSEEEKKDTQEKPAKQAKSIVKEKGNSTNDTNDATTKHEHVDEDDYLIHLEEILRRIHDKFYDTVDQIKELKAKGIKEADSSIARYCSPGTLSPCTKQIIKELQYEVLKGANIVFTGVIPTNIPPEKSDIWQRSERLGAKVSRHLVTPKDARDPSDVTTHVIAARLGTEKTYHAIKTPGIKIVKPDWLWCCGERWEWVDERLFAVEGIEKYKRETRSQRTPQGTPHHWKKVSKTESNLEKIGSDEDVITKDETMRERTCSSSSADLLMASLHPLLSFSSTEMEAMDKEVEELMNSDADDEAESDVIGSISGSSSSSSVSSSSSSSSSSSPSSDNENDNSSDVTKKRKISGSDSEDNTSKKLKEGHSQSDDESDDYTRRSSPSDDDDDGDDDDMAALLEAELSHD